MYSKVLTKSIEKYYVGRMKTMTPRRETKSYVVALKLAGSLVQAIDQEAESEGLSRSAIIRRALLARYQTRPQPADRKMVNV